MPVQSDKSISKATLIFTYFIIYFYGNICKTTILVIVAKLKLYMIT